MTDTFYSYISQNQFYLDRRYKVVDDYDVQKVQNSPEVFIIYSKRGQLFASSFTLALLNYLKGGYSIGDIVGVFGNEDFVLDSIAFSISMLVKSHLLEVESWKLSLGDNLS